MVQRRGRAPASRPSRLAPCCHNRPLLIFAGCLLLFHLANAAMLPLMGSVVTMRSARWATDSDHRLHCRAAARRCRLVAVDRETHPDLGPTPADAYRLRRSSYSRRSLRIGDRPRAAGHRAAPRQCNRRGVQRHGATCRSRSHTWHRAFQSRTGPCRHLHRNWRIAQCYVCRLHQRPLR